MTVETPQNEKTSVNNEINLQEKNTKRACTALDQILFQKIPVLDHGFIVVVDYMGDDESIANSARVSYGKGTKKGSSTKGLLNYLMKHDHTSPFEMCDLKLHLKMPIFVARQWIRHRTASVNEYSARYSILSDEFYVPEQNKLQKQSQTNNQGRDDANLVENPQKMQDFFQQDNRQCYDHYDQMIEADLTRELARINLPISVYTEFYWKINLHNLLHFVRLRADEHSQYEIRVYAQIILEKIIKPWVPIVYEAFINHQFGAKKISQKEIAVLKSFLQNKPLSQKESGLSKRDWNTLIKIFEIKSQEGDD